jgi:hypothetical protein
MISRCAWCGQDLGEREPIGDGRVTHGICPDCASAWDAEGAPGADRRRGGRHPVACECVLQAGAGGAWVVWVCDVSAAGAGFLSPRAVPAGLTVQLVPTAVGSRTPLLGRAAYALREGPAWRCGCSLDGALPEEALRGWLG